MRALTRALALAAVAAVLLVSGGSAGEAATRDAGRLLNPPICC
jgi:hypothetical protein